MAAKWRLLVGYNEGANISHWNSVLRIIPVKRSDERQEEFVITITYLVLGI